MNLISLYWAAHCFNNVLSDLPGGVIQFVPQNKACPLINLNMEARTSHV